jgi:hypothetical protein
MAEIISGIGSALRPAAKEIVKRGLRITRSVSEFTATAGEQIKGLVTEARMELREPQASKGENTESEAAGLCNHLVNAWHIVWNSASSMLSTANAALVDLVARFTGESEQEAQHQVKKDERVLKHLGESLTKEECAEVIETLILMAA